MPFSTTTQHRTGGWMFMCSCGAEGEHRGGDRSQAYRDRAHHEKHDHPQPTPEETPVTTTEPGRYTKKPVTIEAMQWDGTTEGATRIIEWVLANGGTAHYHEPEVMTDETGTETGVRPEHIAVDTMEGTMRAGVRWWVIRGIKGEFYPCDAAVFQDSYDPEVTS